MATDVIIVGRAFTSTPVTVVTADAYAVTSAFNVSQDTNVTFFIKNLGSNAATVKLIISPDDTFYADDGIEVSVPLGFMVPVIPAIYSKFARIAYKSTISGASTTLLITFQGVV